MAVRAAGAVVAESGDVVTASAAEVGISVLVVNASTEVLIDTGREVDPGEDGVEAAVV